MITKYVLPILAVGRACLLRSTRWSRRGSRRRTAQPIVEPPTRPDQVTMIAGSGLVEARRENIPIGVNIPGRGHRGLRQEGRKGQGGRSALPDRRPRLQGAARGARGRAGLGQGAAPQADRLAPARGHPAGQGGRRRGRGQDERRRGRAGADRAAVPEADDRRQRLRQGSLRLSTPPRRPTPRPRPTSSASWREAGRKTSRSPGPPSSSPRARSTRSRPTSSGSPSAPRWTEKSSSSTSGWGSSPP